MAIVVFVSDMHINNVLGLMPKYVRLDNGNEVNRNAYQEALYRCYLNFCELVNNAVEKGDEEKYVVINGDVVDIIAKRTDELITYNRSIVIDIALRVLSEVVTGAKHIFFTRGTPFHEVRINKCPLGH